LASVTQLTSAPMQPMMLANGHGFAVGLAIIIYGAPAGALTAAGTSFYSSRRLTQRAVRSFLAFVLSALLGALAGELGAAGGVSAMELIMDRLTGLPAISWAADYFWLYVSTIVLGGGVAGILVGWAVYLVQTRRIRRQGDGPVRGA